MRIYCCTLIARYCWIVDGDRDVICVNGDIGKAQQLIHCYPFSLFTHLPTVIIVFFFSIGFDSGMWDLSSVHD